MNWREVGLAYRTFLGDPGVGIRHILRAQRQSVWQCWVNRRLARQQRLVVAVENEAVFRFYEKYGFFPGYSTLFRVD